MTPPAAAAPAVPRGRAGAPARKLTPAPRPRRVSGPARPARPARPAGTARPAAGSPREQGLALGLAAALGSVVQSRRLDRLIRGRAWIAIVAFALIGIVTLQLSLLQLNAGMGRSIARAETLQRQDASLAIENSQLAAGSRVEALAARLGMVVVPSGTLRFLHAGTGTDEARAASALTAPSSTATAPGTEASGGESSSTVSTGAGEPVAATQATGGTSEPSSASTEPEASQGTSPQTAQAPSTTPTSSEAASTPAGEAAPAGGTQAGPGG